MKCEIYVETTPNTGVYERLDMHDDEDVILNLKLKDTNDIGKVYSTFSQSFTIPTKDKNDRVLNFFFNPEVKVINGNKGRTMNAKIYINSQLFKVGYIIISEQTYKMLNPTDITITFYTGASTLKERIGEDTLASLVGYVGGTSFTWNDSNVLLNIQNPYSNIRTPLISTQTVYSYGVGLANDIKYTGPAISGTKQVSKEELRPALAFSKIVNAIINKYELDVDLSLSGSPSSDVYSNLFVWCNNSFSQTSPKPMAITNSFGAYQDAFTGVTHTWDISATTGNTFSITRPSGGTNNQLAEFSLLMDTKLLLKGIEDISIKYQFIDMRPATIGQILYETDVTIKNNEGSTSGTTVQVKFDVGYYQKYNITPTNPLLFQLYITSNQAITWNDASYNLLVTDVSIYPFGPIYGKNSINNNSTSMNMDTLELMNLIPNMKIIDFLDSFYKMFNIRVIEENFSNKTYWVDGKTFESSRPMVDYSMFANIENSRTSTQDVFKTYTLTHNASKNYANVNYKLANTSNPNSKGYGQLIYNTNTIYATGDYKVGTKFNLPVPIVLKGMWYETFYGFTSDSPEINSTGNSIYKPNLDEFTIFYGQGSTRIYEKEPLGDLAWGAQPYGYIGFKVGSSVVSVDTLNYWGVTNRNVSLVSGTDIDGYYNASLGFKDEVRPLGRPAIYELNLYSNYYSATIERINNPYTFLYNFKVILPPTEINDFDMRNKVIIGQNVFTIEEAKINLTTGAVDLKLLNIV